MLFFFQGYGDHRDLHSFPTRRSSDLRPRGAAGGRTRRRRWTRAASSETRRCALRSEEHTSELQSHVNLVCRLLLEKKKNTPLIARGTATLVAHGLPSHGTVATLTPRA